LYGSDPGQTFTVGSYVPQYTALVLPGPLQANDVEIRLIDGRGDPDPDSLLKLDAALRQYLPAAEPAGAKLVINVAQLCAKCGGKLEVEPPPPLPPLRFRSDEVGDFGLTG
jgi:hypothetical protein